MRTVRRWWTEPSGRRRVAERAISVVVERVQQCGQAVLGEEPSCDQGLAEGVDSGDAGLFIRRGTTQRRLPVGANTEPMVIAIVIDAIATAIDDAIRAPIFMLPPWLLSRSVDSSPEPPQPEAAFLRPGTTEVDRSPYTPPPIPVLEEASMV